MRDDVIRVAVGLLLGLSLCCQRICLQRRAEVSALVIHISCGYSKRHHSCYITFNDMIWMSLSSKNICCQHKSIDIFRYNSKRTDRVSIL